MWNFLKGVLESGVIIRIFFKTIWYLFLAIMLIALLFGLKTFGLMLAVMMGPAFLERVFTYLQGKYLDIETVPYWGRKFGFKQTVKLLAEDRFHPYVFKNGKVCRKLKVSESGRWFMVAGRFYPLYLVKKFDRRSCEILMMDGTLLREQSWLGDFRVAEALEEIFADRGFYSEGFDENILRNACKTAFLRVCGDDYKALGKADWDEVRYQLEKEIKEIQAGSAGSKMKKRHMRDIVVPDEARKMMHSRVLIDREIEAISDAIRCGAIRNMEGWFDMARFNNDILVCNGVKILMSVGYPKNSVGEEFLFQCITDIEKPYFEDAVTTLSRFPRKGLIEQIEKRMAIAHDRQDVVAGAGLIYLAGKIGYEISLAKENNVRTEVSADDSAEAKSYVSFGGSAAAVQNEFEKKVLEQGDIF